MKFNKLSPAEMAWLGIGLYEAGALAVGGGHTLSEGIDRFCDNENKLVRYGVRAFIGYTALHLSNVLPQKYDAFHHLTNLKDKLK